ncbi:MAG: tRNA (adenosine(37)-N6)-threonylcarbamoyltransferase complex ATPase subunit type 1 TsaE [Planctomycetota bacterium]
MISPDSHELLRVIDSGSSERSLELGRRLGAELVSDQGVALDGELGAGKTLFTRGLAEGLGVDEPGEVRSPSYLLMIEHPGRVPLLHMDAYFADRGTDFLEDGGAVYQEEGGVLVIEWAKRLSLPMPEDFLAIEILHRGPTLRQFRFHGHPELWLETVSRLDRLAHTGKKGSRSSKSR